jgi:nucleotide-binding universal stress UspA family protein
MFKHILVPTDGSALSSKVVKQAVQLAKGLGTRVTALHIVGNYRPVVHDGSFFMPEIPDLRKRFEEATSGHVKKILSAVKKVAEAAGVECNTVAMNGDVPFEMIIKQAKKAKCDLIMMASHGRKC